MAYAEVDDLQDRLGRELDSDESARAEVLLGDASAVLTELVDVREGDEEQAKLLKMVCCNMVIRVMAQSASDAYGLSSITMTAGPYSQTSAFSNPSGDMYLTRLERQMLGISTGCIGYIRPMMAGEHDD